MAIESGRKRGRFTWRWFGLRFGFERSPIVHGGSLYMDRWILYAFSCTLRLHKICRPDLARALHNHPFWFVTFPLGEYKEIVAIDPDQWPPVSQWLRDHLPDGGWVDSTRYVRPFRFHLRGVKYRHRIVSLLGKPHVWTIVVTGPYAQKWGFFPTPLQFVPWDSTEASKHQLEGLEE